MSRTQPYLQAAFYTEAERVGAWHGELAVQGSRRGAYQPPSSFRATAVALEDLAAVAHKEQLPKITSRRYLAAAIGIHSVEARHAAWIRRLAGIVPANTSFDEPLSDGKGRQKNERDAIRVAEHATHERETQASLYRIA